MLQTFLRNLPVPLPWLRRAAIILVFLAAELFLGRMMAQGNQEMLLMAIFGLLGGLVLYGLGRLEYGILGIILAAGLVRFSLSTGTESKIVASLAVTLVIIGLWLAEMLLVDKRLWLKSSPINRPALAFIAICLISYVWSNSFRDPLVRSWGSFPMVQVAALMVMIILPTVLLLVVNRIQEIVWLKGMGWILISIGVGAIVSYLGRLPTRSLFGTGGIFPAWAVAFSYAYALFDERLGWRIRVTLTGVAVMWVYWTFLRGLVWMSGWVPAFAAMGTITLLRSKKMAILLACVVLLFFAAHFDYYWHAVVVSSEEEGDYERLDLWKTNLDLVLKHPLFGTGPAGYAIYYMTYHPENARSTHNNYFDIIAQTGLTGIGVYLWLLGTLAWIGYRLNRTLAGRRDFEAAFAAATMGGTTAAIVSGMLGDWVLPFAYNQTIMGFDHSVYTWLMMGGMVALYHIVMERQEASMIAGNCSTC